MKILVTGGTGFIGSHVADLLASKGHEVTVIDNFANSNYNNLNSNYSIKFYKIDLRNYNHLKNIFKQESFDLVCHQGALINTPESFKEKEKYHDTNVLGTYNILQLSSHYNIKKVVLASSCSIYGDNCTLNTKEDTKKNPMSPYAFSKYLNEVYAEQFKKFYGLKVVCLRYSNVYGAKQLPKDSVISNFIVSILKNNPIYIHGDGKQTRDFIHVEDVANANLLALTKKHSGLSYNVGNFSTISINDIYNKVNKILKRKTVSITTGKRRGDIYKVSLDNSLIKRELGFKPKINIDEGLNKTIEYWRAHV